MSNSILLSYPGPDPLGGIICTSGLIALAEDNFNKTTEAVAAQKNTPLLLYHGEKDSVVNFGFANQTYQYYETTLKAGQSSDLFEFKKAPNMDHCWDEEEQKYITQWIKDRVKPIE